MNRRVIRLFLISITALVTQILAAPLDTEQSLVVSSTEPSNGKESRKGDDLPEVIPKVPEIYQMYIQSNIRNRFTNTTVVSRVRNLAQESQEATFSVVLPETAFISGFIMEVDNKNYTAYVKEKEEAKRDYDQAVAKGLGAAHIAVSARDSNRFTVSVNIEPEAKAAFYLSYEELLKRQNGHYEQVINIHPGQPVKDLSVAVFITESRKLTDLKAPPLRSGNEIGNENSELDPRADLEKIDDKTAVVRFRPNLERQKQIAHLLGTNEEEGLAGQFVVQYDVERDSQGGEVLIQDGYFVHFFAPTDLPPLPKHVVFVLDTSSSMWGQKIQQLKEAMLKILGELHENDLFNLVEFNTNVKVWDLNNADASVWFPSEDGFEDYSFPNAYLATGDNIKKAKNTVTEFVSTGATNIYTALRVALHLVELAKNTKIDELNRQPILVFLTDGDPTVGLTNVDDITNKISELNTETRKSSIFTLSFGTSVDKKFLQRLAIRNSGFAKHIYEAADAALQLQDFYKQISSPLLSNVQFKYEPSVTSLTKTEFPIHFGGSEIVVCGWYGKHELESPTVDAWGAKGRIYFKSNSIEKSVSNIERLWVYLTIKQLLEKKEVDDKNKEEMKKKALDLALKYSFVTPVSSLVVVKPNDTNAVNTEEANNESYADRPLASHIQSSYVPLRASLASSFSLDTEDYHTYGAGLSGPRGQSGDSIFLAMSRPLLPPLPPTPSLQLTPNRDFQISYDISVTDLLTELPWLKDIVNENETINLISGTYKLGLNNDVTDNVTCTNTPLNTTGHCSLLHSCPQVYSLLTSTDVYIQHFCVLKGNYAGVCCPTNS